MKNLLSLSLLATLLVSALPAAPVLNYLDAGWYDQAGSHNPSNVNYFTGSAFGSEYRGFVLFDLTGVLNGSILSAEIRLTNRDTGATSGSPFVLNLHPVTTSASAITDGTSGAAGFTDLGDGASLGSVNINTDTPGTVTIAFNAVGLTYLNNAAGGQVVLGLAIASPSNNQYLFTNENFGPTGASTIQLDINNAPEPATFVSLGAALVALAAVRRRR